jgi:hypothetical protein
VRPLWGGKEKIQWIAGGMFRKPATAIAPNYFCLTLMIPLFRQFYIFKNSFQ